MYKITSGHDAAKIIQIKYRTKVNTKKTNKQIQYGNSVSILPDELILKVFDHISYIPDKVNFRQSTSNFLTLLSKDRNIQDFKDNKLIDAIKSNRLEYVKLMIDAGAFIKESVEIMPESLHWFTHPNSSKFSVLRFAIDQNIDPLIILALINAKANPNETFIHPILGLTNLLSFARQSNRSFKLINILRNSVTNSDNLLNHLS
tara:strand:+ start:112 stop:720 length:609 start_codon:yes stop_codon:yes gene_type:complete